jgi:hypothetical protein
MELSGVPHSGGRASMNLVKGFIHRSSTQFDVFPELKTSMEMEGSVAASSLIKDMIDGFALRATKGMRRGCANIYLNENPFW